MPMQKFECKACNMSFASKEEMQAHGQKHHKK